MTVMLNNLIREEDYRSILCLNGELPNADFFAGSSLPIIAADGAANHLKRLGILPTAVIGDLDSIDFTHTGPVIMDPNQNSTDFEKCLIYLRENDLLPTIIVGISGGYIDHILNNLNIFLGTDSVFYAPPVAGFVLKPGEKEFRLPLNTKISLLGLPDATVSTSGLKWELNETVMTFPGKNGCFNRTVLPLLTINLLKGQLLTLLYLEKIHDAGSNGQS